MSAPNPIQRSVAPAVSVEVVDVVGRIVKTLDGMTKKIDAIEENIQISEKGASQEDKQVQAQIKELRSQFCQEMHKTFSTAFKELAAAQIDSSKMPAPVALRLAALMTRYGIFAYGKSHFLESGLDWDKQTKEHKYIVAFARPLVILEAALIMHTYALGQVDHYPDFAKAQNIDDILNNTDLAQSSLSQTEKVIERMLPPIWAQASQQLSQAELIMLSKGLRYTNGAIRYLGHINNQPGQLGTVMVQQMLLATAEAALIQGKHNPNHDLKVLNNELAELKYNDVSGLLMRMRDDLKAMLDKAIEGSPEQKRLQEEYQQAANRLTLIWDECIALSADPEAMKARCKNKRAFDIKSPDEELPLRRQAVEDHRALPPERKMPSLYAIALGNLGSALLAKGEEDEARKCFKEAIVLVQQQRAKGDNSVVFANIIEQCERLKIS